MKGVFLLSNNNKKFQETVISTLDNNPSKKFNEYADELNINKWYRYDLLKKAIQANGGSLDDYRGYLKCPSISIGNTGVSRFPSYKSTKGSNHIKNEQLPNSVNDAKNSSIDSSTQSFPSETEQSEFDIIFQIEAEVLKLKEEIDTLMFKEN